MLVQKVICYGKVGGIIITKYYVSKKDTCQKAGTLIKIRLKYSYSSPQTIVVSPIEIC